MQMDINDKQQILKATKSEKALQKPRIYFQEKESYLNTTNSQKYRTTMRTYGKDSDNSQKMEYGHMHGPTCIKQGHPMVFQPLTYYGYPGMVRPPYQFARRDPAHKEMMSTNQEASGYSSGDEATAPKPAIANLPPFAKKWFDLDQAKRKELRQMREKWIASQKECGKEDPAKDMDAMKTVLPKFAAKWLTLSEDEKQHYRAFNGRKTCGSAIPPFAAKWFELPEDQKKEYRQLNMTMKTTKTALVSDSDQSEPEADLEHASLPQFATKWFELPQEKRNAIRIKYRHAQKCQKQDCDGLKKMLTIMQFQNRCGQHSGVSRPHPILMSPEGPTAPMTWRGQCCVKPKHPIGVPSQYSHMRGHCMGVPPFVLMKKWQHIQKARQSDASTSDSSSSDDEATDVPPFVKKWFALPMEARQHLRMMKQHQMKHGKSAADGIAPFAKKWFALPEKKKQHWRKLHCVQKKQTATAEATPLLRRDDVDVDGAAIPEFAQEWFALPMQQKHHFRMLNKYLSAKDQDESGTSEDEEYSETMPEFAAKWFSLSSEERQRLRTIKHIQKTKQDPCHSKARKSFGKFGAHPRQHWAYHTMPPMGYFGGFTHALHRKSSEDKFGESGSDN